MVVPYLVKNVIKQNDGEDECVRQGTTRPLLRSQMFLEILAALSVMSWRSCLLTIQCVWTGFSDLFLQQSGVWLCYQPISMLFQRTCVLKWMILTQCTCCHYSVVVHIPVCFCGPFSVACGWVYETAKQWQGDCFRHARREWESKLTTGVRGKS